jgi:DmsE family decaheme c-type cytochrome
MLLAATLVAAAPVGGEDAAVPATQADATYIGADLCVSCHEEPAASYAKTPHAVPLASESRPESARGCEACHGPGSLHFEQGGTGPIQAFRALESAGARSAPCLACHAGESHLQDWRAGDHAKAGVACTDCHELHGGTGAALLKKATPELCYGCHLDVRAQFALPERHRVDENALACGDCHTPHGSQNQRSLLRPDDRTCLSCHNELTGPFVFEHAGLVVEGCGSCHVPHGSVNRHLLHYQQVASLCYQCHTVTPSDHVQPSYRDCTRCHVDIHGSNIDPHFLQ